MKPLFCNHHYVAPIIPKTAILPPILQISICFCCESVPISSSMHLHMRMPSSHCQKRMKLFFSARLFCVCVYQQVMLLQYTSRFPSDSRMYCQYCQRNDGFVHHFYILPKLHCPTPLNVSLIEVWATIVANVVSIISSSNEAIVEHQYIMDEVNRACEVHFIRAWFG